MFALQFLLFALLSETIFVSAQVGPPGLTGATGARGLTGATGKVRVNLLEATSTVPFRCHWGQGSQGGHRRIWKRWRSWRTRSSRHQRAHRSDWFASFEPRIPSAVMHICRRTRSFWADWCNRCSWTDRLHWSHWNSRISRT
jgi:hypothetical protein